VRDILGKLDNKAAQKCLEVKGVDWRLPVEGESNTHDLHPENYNRVFGRAEIILRKITEAEAKKPKLITAADVESGNLDPLMLKTVEIIVREVTAHDDALDAVDKHKGEALSFLANLKDRFDKDGFAAFKTKFFPGLSASTVYKRIEVATGKKLLEDLRARNARYQEKHRQKLAAQQGTQEAYAAQVAKGTTPKGSSPTAGQKVRGADGKPLDTSGFGGPAKEQLEAELARSAGPKPVGPGIPEPPAEPVAEPVDDFDKANAAAMRKSGIEPVVKMQKLEDYLAQAMKAANSQFPAYTVCLACIEHLVQFMNEGTRAQLRKDVSAITMKALKSDQRKAA
jgi:hypothetical protein